MRRPTPDDGRSTTGESTSDPFADLPLTHDGLDRQGHRRADPVTLRGALADPRTQVLDLRGGRLPIRSGRLHYRQPRAEDDGALLVLLGVREGRSVIVRVDPDDPRPAHSSTSQPPTSQSPTSPTPTSMTPARPPRPSDERGTPDEITRRLPAEQREELLDEAVWSDLRGAASVLDPTEASLAATAVAMANWHRGYPRCPRCGTPTEVVASGWARRCPHDGSEHHPRTDSAIIVSVTDDEDRLLLVRNVGWPEDRFSVIAGFVEPGETFASAVAREVGEEVGLQVRDVRVVAEQPWPFPASLMIGATARATSTDLNFLDGEIADARWYTRQGFVDDLASGRLNRATRLSISARLVEQWLGRRLDQVPGPG